MKIIIGIIIFLIILALAIIIYAIFGPTNVVLPTYNNNVLDLIKSQQSWGFNNGKMTIPYIFKITGTNLMQISYFDSLGGYLQGVVNFNANYKIIDINNIQIIPTSLISSATKRWPQNQIWKLTFINSSNLNLNIGKNILSLSIN